MEMDELIKTMNSLVKDLDTINVPPEDGDRNSKVLSPDATKEKEEKEQDSLFLENRRNNIPRYPLIGSLPSTLLDLNGNDEFHNESSSGAATPEPDDSGFEAHSPYSSHKREKRKTPLKPIFDDDLQLIDIENEADDMVDGPTRTRDSSSITEESNFEDEATLGDEASDVESIYDNVSTTIDEAEEKNTVSFLRGESGGGIIISKRLRQKGISIIVGSSSSEGMCTLTLQLSNSFISLCEHEQ